MIELLLSALAIIALGTHVATSPHGDLCAGVVMIAAGLVLGTLVLIAAFQASSVVW